MFLRVLKTLKDLLLKVWFLWFISLALDIITFFLIYRKIGFENRISALRYNVLVGVDWYGKGGNLYFIPAIGLAILAVNYSFYRTSKGKGYFLSPLAVLSAMFVQAVLLISVIFLTANMT